MEKQKSNNKKTKTDVTEEINKALQNDDYAKIQDVMSLTPELKTLYDIRRKIINSINNNQPIDKLENLYKLNGYKPQENSEK
jgi:hypothetical protein